MICKPGEALYSGVYGLAGIEWLEARIAPASLGGINFADYHKRMVSRGQGASAPVTPELFIVSNLANAGPGSLRNAITNADAATGAAEIIFRTGSHGKTMPLTGMITLKSYLPALTNPEGVTIRAAAVGGAPGITINGAGKVQDLQITGGNVSLEDLRIINGRSQFGAGIYIDDLNASITISNSVISGNRAVGINSDASPDHYADSAEAGGIAIVAGSVTLRNDSITKNFAIGGQADYLGDVGGAALGGGIMNEDTLTVIRSSIVGNRAIGGANAAYGNTVGGSAYGGGVENFLGTVTIQQSIISDNRATGGKGIGAAGSKGVGGGVATANGSVTIENSSRITGNVASGGKAGESYMGGNGYGGGVYGYGSPLTVIGSSISGNVAIGGKGGPGINHGAYTDPIDGQGGNGGNSGGGGICNFWGQITIDPFISSSAKVAVQPSLLSGNFAIGGRGGNGARTYNGPNAAPSYHGHTNPGVAGEAGYSGGSGGYAAGGAIENSVGNLYIQTSIISGNATVGGNGGHGGSGGNGGDGSAGGMYRGHAFPAGLGGNGGPGGNGGFSGGSTGAGIASISNSANIGYGKFVVKGSTISGNTAIPGKTGRGGPGGAAGTGGSYVYNGALVTAHNGPRGNRPAPHSSYGGGIYSTLSSITLSLVTVTENTAGNGGGVAIIADVAAAIHNSTIAFNKAYLAGGGLFLTPDSANDPVNLVSTIVSNNFVTVSGTGAPDVSGAVTAVYTIIGNDTGTTVNLDEAKDPYFFATPLQAPVAGPPGLRDGGVTGTLLATQYTPAVPNNAASNPDGLTADQNGVAFGAGNIIIGAVDTMS
jgi:hypothetical protein